MKSTTRALVSLLLAGCSLAALAQRRAIPIVELIDVPVSLATQHKPTRDQVRETIIAAAIASEWDVDLQPDGSLTLSMEREFDSHVTVSVSYSATNYSIRYVTSENLNYFALGELRPMNVALSTYVADWRATRSAKLPEFKYAVDKQPAVIHPAYEGYVYGLSASIRRHLKWALR